MNIKRIVLTVLVILSSTVINFAQTTGYTLDIKVVNLKSNKGNVLLQMSDENEEFVSGGSAKIKDNTCNITISNVKKGYYAIRYFHDENGNNILDTNWFGIPSEGYGFSNNATSMFGIPSVKDRLFEVKSNLKITLYINY